MGDPPRWWLPATRIKIDNFIVCKGVSILSVPKSCLKMNRTEALVIPSMGMATIHVSLAMEKFVLVH